MTGTLQNENLKTLKIEKNGKIDFFFAYFDRHQVDPKISIRALEFFDIPTNVG